jgi:hypothetical protein
MALFLHCVLHIPTIGRSSFTEIASTSQGIMEISLLLLLLLLLMLLLVDLSPLLGEPT